MNYLVDTNVLARWVVENDPLHLAAVAAVDNLVADGHNLHVAPQNLFEFWNIVTRPVSQNGFGLTPAQADIEAGKIESFFPMLEDSPAVYAEWRRLVVAVAVSGVQVHDARLTAIMRVHGVTHILTLNPRDFARYGVIVVEPQNVTRP